jgi:carboxyl-terminal processing protease
MNNYSKKSIVYQPLLYAFLLSLGLVVGFKLSNPQHFFIKKITGEDGKHGGTGKVEEVIRFIDSKYVYGIDASELTEVALTSIIQELDPHSNYLSKDELKKVNEQMSGNYNGIGIETLLDGDTLVVVKILEKSPASKSGIKLFDRIVSIDDQLVADLNGKETVSQKDNDDQTALLIDREGEEIELIITNGLISSESTCMAVSINDSISYLKINQFNAQVYKDFNFALESLAPANIKHLIVDLRGNPGGYLPETAKILSLFFEEKDKLLVKTIDKNKKVSEYKSTGRQFYQLEKIAIIVDANSASGSEILAGAIQDWDRGVIVGQTTYGKGLVQEQYTLNNGGALRLTIAEYLTPSGRFIQKPFKEQELDTQQFYSLIHKRPLANKSGIVPDLVVDIPNECFKSVEKQLSKIAYDLIREQEWHKSNSPNEIKSLSFDQLNQLSDTQFLNSDTTHSPSCLVELERKIKYSIFSLLYSEDKAFEIMKDTDPFVQEALTSITSRDLLVKSIE